MKIRSCVNKRTHILFLEEMVNFSLQDLLSWLKTTDVQSKVKNLDEIFWSQYPKVIFLKNLKANSIVLDLGTGDGTLVNFKKFTLYDRQDLVFYGASLEAPLNNYYDKFIKTNIEKSFPTFKILPNAYIISQFLEHMSNPLDIMKKVHKNITPGGKVYIDFPSSHSSKLPSSTEFAKHGYDIYTLNFYDDETHKSLIDIQKFKHDVSNIGFKIISTGYIDMPYSSELLKTEGIFSKSKVHLTFAMWLKTLFIYYIVLEKI